jgi:hypothetical protein
MCPHPGALPPQEAYECVRPRSGVLPQGANRREERAWVFSGPSSSSSWWLLSWCGCSEEHDRTTCCSSLKQSTKTTNH